MDVGVVLANPGSGPRETDVEALASAFGDAAEVRTTTWRRLPVDVARLVDAGAPFVGVAGGDGSLRLAAPELAASGVALLPVPCGTRNHFAKAVGLDTVEKAAAAARDGVERKVDLAWVGDECFLNTANLGMYTAIVREREQHERLPKRVADAIGAVRQVLQGHRLRTRIDGVPRRSWVVFVGNGRYGDSLADLALRDCLDDGHLDFRIISAEQRLARLRLVGAALAGRLDRTPVVDRLTPDQALMELPGRPEVDVALDGDVVRLRTPLRWRVEPRALTVRVLPADEGGA